MELVQGLFNAHQTVGCHLSRKINFVTFPLALLPSEAGRSERREPGKFPPRYFYHEENIAVHSSQNMPTDYCWKLTEQVQTNELREIRYLSEIKKNRFYIFVV